MTVIDRGHVLASGRTAEKIIGGEKRVITPVVFIKKGCFGMDAFSFLGFGYVEKDTGKKAWTVSIGSDHLIDCLRAMEILDRATKIRAGSMGLHDCIYAHGKFEQSRQYLAEDLCGLLGISEEQRLAVCDYYPSNRHLFRILSKAAQRKSIGGWIVLCELRRAIPPDQKKVPRSFRPVFKNLLHKGRRFAAAREARKSLG